VKHADLIRAALDGKKIQYKYGLEGKWVTFEKQNFAVARLACESERYEYRLEPKPDVVRYFNQYSFTAYGYGAIASADAKAGNHRLCVTKNTYDGETGKLKSVEIVE
jgi:hypothetical protein